MSSAFDKFLKTCSNSVSQEPANHPELDILLAFVSDGVSPETRGQVLSHLEICTDCGDLILALKEEQGNSEKLERSTPLNNAWERFEKNLSKRDVHGREMSDSSRAGPAAFWRRLSTAYGLAAVLLMGLCLSLFTMRDNTSEPLEPVGETTGVDGNPAVLSLLPVGLAKRSSAGSSYGEAESGRTLVLELVLSEPTDYDSYRVRLRHRESVGEYVVAPLTVESLSARLVFSENVLAPGLYIMEIQGLGEDGLFEIINTYSLLIRESRNL